MEVKICGVTQPETLAQLAALRVDFVGFVFFPPSPRALTPAQAAVLSASHPGGPARVGLFVDADDATLAATLATVKLDILQLHGAETPARCAAIRARFGLPVMKALGIGSAADLDALADYATVVDRFLLDAKPRAGDPLPGGNAHPFEWSLLAGRRVPRPWLLAGGLTPKNVAEAIWVSGAPGVDVSSGVEIRRGVKSRDLIEGFTTQARAAATDISRQSATQD
jgi:phosphoribosylanthranilate isomerase